MSSTPTPAETLRIKAFLNVRRRQTRDYLDVAALSNQYSLDLSAGILAQIDEYYSDQRKDEESVRSQLVRQLGEPCPSDFKVTKELHAYRNLVDHWTEWPNVVATCEALAELIAKR
ncbi:hypothetical protein [Natronoglycomyces albus]|uniref:Uncharacterized protein n=1 Tax=Natronoglycomyces albus TaxID=2811108 RepID=A0A895XHN2_9ACTN|nr:hypothetical protein [Natronoglycomyces albus]QSB05341.1 hypothetical protein JQS30_16600 [Natronoglycomyces albus]